MFRAVCLIIITMYAGASFAGLIGDSSALKRFVYFLLTCAMGTVLYYIWLT